MNTIEHNTLLDWKKKDVDAVERSKFISDILRRDKISMRQFAKDNNLNHSTVQDWISMRQKNKSTHAKINRDELISVADRLIFLLSRKENLTVKEFQKVEEAKNEADKKGILR